MNKPNLNFSKGLLRHPLKCLGRGAGLFFAFLGFTTLAHAQEEVDSMSFSMDQAVSYALEHSFQTQTAQQDVYYAQKKIWETTAIGLPQVNGAADYQYSIKIPATPIPAQFVDPDAGEDETILAAFGSKHSMSASLSATQLIFDGSYIVGLQSARTYAAIADLAKIKTDIAVREAVSNAYIGVLVTDEMLNILEGNIQVIEDNVTQVQAMFDNGLAEEQDVQQLELTLSGLENSLNQNQRMAKINREMLKFAMGLDINQPIILTNKVEEILLSFYEVASLQQALELEDHIDYQISDNNLKSSQLLLRYEKTKYMPNLSAFFNAGYNSYTQIFDFFEFNDDKWAPMAIVGLKLNVPIFSSFQRNARVDMAKIDYEKAKLDHDQLIQNLFRELHVAQDSYAFSIDNFKTAKRRMELAASIEEKENIKYQEGVSTSLDLTNARNQLYQNQQQYLNAIQLVVSSKLSLDKALNKL